MTTNTITAEMAESLRWEARNWSTGMNEQTVSYVIVAKEAGWDVELIEDPDSHMFDKYKLTLPDTLNEEPTEFTTVTVGRAHGLLRAERFIGDVQVGLTVSPAELVKWIVGGSIVAHCNQM